MLAGSSLQSDARSAKDAEKSGNFMEDEQWLSTISQYGRKLKHWNRFRDLRLQMEWVPISSDGSELPLVVQYGNALLDDDARTWDENQGSNDESCTGQDLADLGERLRDWFQLLQSNAKQNNNSKPGARAPAASTTSVLDRSLVASCKDSVGWMFSKLDTNNDLYLDRAELAAINLDKYEICIRPFFNSCDSYRDGKVSTAEWCLCFWREKPACLAELERIQVLDGGNRRFDDEMAYSGDIGSGVGWEDEEEKGVEETAEEAEEEEGEQCAAKRYGKPAEIKYKSRSAYQHFYKHNAYRKLLILLGTLLKTVHCELYSCGNSEMEPMQYVMHITY
ncbi:hypothetical protein F2P81_020274 [Scophthalmus maximus]|uniref:SPARC/Testican calcium-binding domain-containing protein n=1 Tax=Scophthalmus maximus TaxID=52904 RepID=A0A6A4RZL0_SCOMX|nr:hypothetical protein F2P81_020274 [Scophthalmus maximus]